MIVLRVSDDYGDLGEIRVDGDRVEADPASLAGVIESAIAAGQKTAKSAESAARDLDGWSNGVVRVEIAPSP